MIEVSLEECGYILRWLYMNFRTSGGWMEKPFTGRMKTDSSRSRWQGGLESEIAFWNEWIRTRGLHWPDDFIWKTDPASPFQPNLAELL